MIQYSLKAIIFTNMKQHILTEILGVTHIKRVHTQTKVIFDRFPPAIREKEGQGQKLDNDCLHYSDKEEGTVWYWGRYKGLPLLGRDTRQNMITSVMRSDRNAKKIPILWSDTYGLPKTKAKKKKGRKKKEIPSAYFQPSKNLIMSNSSVHLRE